MSKAIITNLNYEQGTSSKLVQGVKNNYRPRGALYGGNGSFIVKGDPPKVLFEMALDGKTTTINLYPSVKRVLDRRMSEKLVNQLKEKVLGLEFEFTDYDLHPAEFYERFEEALSSAITS